MTLSQAPRIIAIYEDLAQARRQILGRRTAASLELSPAMHESIRAMFGADLTAPEVVQRIVDAVRSEGDAAVRRYTELLDRVQLDDLLVPDAALDAALAAISSDLRWALETAAARIRTF